MTDEKPNKKHWYQKAWGKVVATISVITILAGIFQATYMATEFWYEYQAMHAEVEKLTQEKQELLRRLEVLEYYVDRKKKSYQVGFRVVVVSDEDTGLHVKRKKYREWNGEEHTVYRDKLLSDQEGYDYYFWIDSLGNRNYCW